MNDKPGERPDAREITIRGGGHLLKRLLILTGPLATLAAMGAIASAPTPAAADFVCQTGTPSNPTPVCETECVVPNVVGLKLGNGKAEIAQHDCTVGTITVSGPKHKKGFAKQFAVIIAQNPQSGGLPLPQGTAVDLAVQYHFKKVPVKHKKKHHPKHHKKHKNHK
jgi:hypothetical protein